jgi:hypothetical protein
VSNSSSLSQIIGFSWSKSKEILFPFQLKRWLKILLIAWVASMATSPGGNFNFPGPAAPAEETSETLDQAIDPVQDSWDEFDETEGATDLFKGLGDPFSADGSEISLPPATIPVLIGLTLLFFVLALPFIWLSSRFNFIYLDLMVGKESQIVEPFKAHKTIGNSYFFWLVAFTAVVVTVELLLIILARLSPSVLWVSTTLMVIWVIAVAIVAILVLDFVTPIMYRDQISCVEACRKFAALRPPIGSVVIYLLVKIGLTLLAGIAIMLVGLLIAAVVLIASLIIALPGVMIGQAVPALGPLLNVLGFGILLLGVMLTVLALGLVSLPIPIFFRAFSLAFLTRIAPDYNLLGYSA